ncbi:MAG: ribulose-phosphate 3-epimerase [Desulfobacteraceae bacterium]|nr:ribulose-phosphate 3-epimerase [Desulfobacteraceae bacterium]MBC2748981.1 ribulose-phosphate 3-epimerase [Desulfobacteraceae bacterium]
MKLIAPSILSADFARLGEEIQAVEVAGADWIHIDVMDGHFVPNITIGPLIVKAARQSTRLPLDVHLMIENPDRYIAEFVEAGADLVAVQVETCPHLHRTVQLIRECGARPGVVLNPTTPLTAIEWILEDVEFVMLMSVNPGFGGQKFIPATLEKIRQLRTLIGKRRLSTLIEIDGGVNRTTIADIAAAGADVFVAGSAIYGTPDYKAVISEFREIIAASGDSIQA